MAPFFYSSGKMEVPIFADQNKAIDDSFRQTAHF
jgi:hypothetical protein